MSVALILATQDRIVAASDSRAWDAARSTYVDNVRKIDIADGHLFAATGLGDLALDAWQVTPPVPGEAAKPAAERILGTLEEMLLDHEGDLLFGIFRFRGVAPDSHAIRVHVQGARANVLETGKAVTMPYAMCFGWDDVRNTKDFLEQSILPKLALRLPEAAMLGLARETIRMAGFVSTKVGGKVHLAVLDGGGARWAL